MKKTLVAGLLLVTAAWMMAFRPAPAPPATLKWYTWEEAVELNKTKPKKMFVDVYTDWCGWCKKMDKSTFADPAVAAYLAENFYPVKLNAEQKADIQFAGEFLLHFLQDGSHRFAGDAFVGAEIEKLG